MAKYIHAAPSSVFYCSTRSTTHLQCSTPVCYCSSHSTTHLQYSTLADLDIAHLR